MKFCNSIQSKIYSNSLEKSMLRLMTESILGPVKLLFRDVKPIIYT